MTLKESTNKVLAFIDFYALYFFIGSMILIFLFVYISDNKGCLADPTGDRCVCDQRAPDSYLIYNHMPILQLETMCNGNITDSFSCTLANTTDPNNPNIIQMHFATQQQPALFSLYYKKETGVCIKGHAKLFGK